MPGRNGKVVHKPDRYMFKVRLVVKGFTQKEGIDYDKVFFPIAILKSIRILLSIAAHFDYEIW